MERISERFNKELKGELILHGKIYDVTLENFAEKGIKVTTEPNNSAVDYLSDEIIYLEFEIPSGEVLNLHCKIIWSSIRSSDSLMKDIGLEITEESPKYDDFYKSLCIDDMLFL